MDLYCPVCGRPWDADELHSIPDMRYGKAVQEFRAKGCEVFGSRHNSERNGMAEISKVAFEALDDDTDAIAALLEDYF